MENMSGERPPTNEGYELTSSERNTIRSTGLWVRVWAILSLIAGVLAVGIVGPLLSEANVPGVIYVLLALIPIFIGLNFDKAGRALGLVGTEGRDAHHLMRAVQRLGLAFLFQIVAVVSWVSILVVFEVSSRPTGRERAFIAAQRSDLQNLARMQELFFRNDEDGDGVSEYAGNLAALSEVFVTSMGVTVHITEASELGWAAMSTHADLVRRGCAIYMGDATPPATVGGTVPEEAGTPACDL